MRRLLDQGTFGGVEWSAAFLVVNTGLVLASLLVGLGVVGGPEPLRISLVFYALFIVPGASLSGLVFPAPLAPIERVCIVFGLGLSFVSAVACVGFAPHVSYIAMSIIAGGLAVALLALGRARRTGAVPGGGGAIAAPTRPGAPRGRVVLACAALGALSFIALYGRGELGIRTDALDHVSYVRRSVESGVLFPRDSFYRDGDGASFDVRKGLWHPVLSLWAYQSHAPADRVWRLIPSFTAFFALGSFFLLALELCGSGLNAVVALAFLLLFQGGNGLEWLTKLGYSKNIAQVLLWLDIACLCAYCRTRERGRLILACCVAAVGAAYHVVFALLLGTSLCALFVYATFLRDGAAWRAPFWRSAAALAVTLAIPLAARWPTFFAGFNEIHTHEQGMLVFSRHLAIVDPAELARVFGISFFWALLAAPFFFIVAPRRGRRSLAFLLFCVPVVLVLDPLTAPLLERRIGYLHYRMLDAAPIAVILALVVVGLIAVCAYGRPERGREKGPETRRARWRGVVSRIAAACALVLLGLYPFRASVREVAASARSIAERGEGMPARYLPLVQQLGERIPDHSVIVSDPLTSYVLSAYTNYFVVVTLDQHGSPTDTEALARLREVRDLLSPAVPLAASRAWLERERADYVLLDTQFPENPDFFVSALPGSSALAEEKLRDCPELLRHVLDVGGFRLFRVRSESAGLPLDPACAAARAIARPCEVERAPREAREGLERDTGCGIVCARCAIENGSFHEGDTLRGYFCWRARDPVAFGLPLDVVVRIDTDYPKGIWYRSWYGKQYRRIVERRRGHFYRFTWEEPLASGFARADEWEPGGLVRQDFALPLSRWMAPGSYVVSVKVIRRAFLMNRSLADYLSNDDSLEGISVARIAIEEKTGDSTREGAAGPNAGAPYEHEDR